MRYRFSANVLFVFVCLTPFFIINARASEAAEQQLNMEAAKNAADSINSFAFDLYRSVAHDTGPTFRPTDCCNDTRFFRVFMSYVLNAS